MLDDLSPPARRIFWYLPESGLGTRTSSPPPPISFLGPLSPSVGLYQTLDFRCIMEIGAASSQKKKITSNWAKKHKDSAAHRPACKHLPLLQLSLRKSYFSSSEEEKKNLPSGASRPCMISFSFFTDDKSVMLYSAMYMNMSLSALLRIVSLPAFRQFPASNNQTCVQMRRSTRNV